MSELEGLRDHPELGLAVPEHGIQSVRDLIVRSYRLVYRVSHERRVGEVIRVWRAARSRPDL